MLRVASATLDCVDVQRITEFWCAALGYEVDKDFGQFVFLHHPNEHLPRLGLQRVPEPKTGKNRMHLDLNAGDREEEVRRLVSLGAQEVERNSFGDYPWVVMADPEGNEFCLGG